MDGVLVLDKPSGLTSHDVVARVRRVLGTRRIGHVGTLDPLATGVLPLVVGRATRLSSLLSSGPKTYDAVILLGVTTDTYDVTGTATAHGGASTPAGPMPALTAIQEVCRSFTGTFAQQPPPFSAKKVGGVRAYQLARRRQPVAPSPVEVTVHALEIRSLEGDRLRCRVTCESGFYMRALAHDLGRALGCGGCLETLRRERNGAFALGDAVSLDTVEREHQNAHRRLIPLVRLLPELPGVVLTDRGSRLAVHGNALAPADIMGNTGDDPPYRHAQAEGGEVYRVKLFDREGVLLAIAETETGSFLHPKIVLV